jgi:hypothetical protein
VFAHAPLSVISKDGICPAEYEEFLPCSGFVVNVRMKLFAQLQK